MAYQQYLFISSSFPVTPNFLRLVTILISYLHWDDPFHADKPSRGSATAPFKSFILYTIYYVLCTIYYILSSIIYYDCLFATFLGTAVSTLPKYPQRDTRVPHIPPSIPPHSLRIWPTTVPALKIYLRKTCFFGTWKPWYLLFFTFIFLSFLMAYHKNLIILLVRNRPIRI
jgi:hypothetical protein